MRASVPLGSPRILLLAIAASLLLPALGCESLDPLSRRSDFKDTQKRFSQYVRYGALTKASKFVVKDMRNVGPSSVRFIAAQGTEDLPNLLLVGGSKEIWPKVREAVLESEAMGYPVRAILVGPQGESPALEIYAKGWKVTNPINPNEINQNILVQLIQNVHHEYYEAH